jgi:hypothetical protein
LQLIFTFVAIIVIIIITIIIIVYYPRVGSSELTTACPGPSTTWAVINGQAPGAVSSPSMQTRPPSTIKSVTFAVIVVMVFYYGTVIAQYLANISFFW